MSKGKITEEKIVFTGGTKGKGEKKEPASETEEKDPKGLKAPNYEDMMENLKRKEGARGKGTQLVATAGKAKK